MGDVEKAIEKLLNFETNLYNSFHSVQDKKRFEDAVEEVKPTLLKNQETKDEALNITYKIYTKRYLGINIIGFLLKEKANPTMIIDNKPIIDFFLLEEEIVKLFISAGFDVNAKLFQNDNTLLMQMIERYHIFRNRVTYKKILEIIDYMYNLKDFDPNVKNKKDETVYFFCLSNMYLFEASYIFSTKNPLEYTNSSNNNSLLLLSKTLIDSTYEYEIYNDEYENSNNDRERWEEERDRRNNFFGGALIFGQNQLKDFYYNVLLNIVENNNNLINSYNNEGEYVLYYLTMNDKLYDFINIFLNMQYDNEEFLKINLKTEKIPYTALYNCVINNLLDSANLLLNYKADANIQDDETKNTPLHLAIINKHNNLVHLLLPKTDLNIKNSDNLTALELALKIKDKDIIKIIKEATALWKGSSRSDLEKYDLFFENPFDWSVCPVCLEYVERADGCMFVSHDCATTKHYYHMELYNRYKFQYDTTKIEWCSVCGRITEFHNHFKLTYANAAKAQIENKDRSILQRIERGENEVFFDNKNCIGLGGGGTEEKASRLRRLREYAIELQDDVGKKKYMDAMKELIEEVWNAPLRREKKKIRKILEKKKFNNNLKNLPNIIRENNNNNNSGENVNIEYNGELPKKLDPKTHSCYIGASENEGEETNPVYEFQHKSRNGIDHSDRLICKDDLELFIENQNRAFGVERFAKCFDLTCNAFLYPQEIKSIVSNDMYEEYRKKFNKKIRKNMAGGKYKHKTRKLKKHQFGGDIQHVLHKLENISCYQPPVPTKKKKNSSKRITLKRFNRNIV
jgi:hypothetical protein